MSSNVYIVEHVVDNRAFLLGLDAVYRREMKSHERSELLACARRVAAQLGVEPADVPVEGYYYREPALTEYFRLVRGLQEAPETSRPEVEALPEFHRLLSVTCSPIFGAPDSPGHLFPRGRDPLLRALEATAPDWSVDTLTRKAQVIARDSDDYSLVGLTARSGEPTARRGTAEAGARFGGSLLGGGGGQHDPRPLCLPGHSRGPVLPLGPPVHSR